MVRKRLIEVWVKNAVIFAPYGAIESEIWAMDIDAAMVKALELSRLFFCQDVPYQKTELQSGAQVTETHKSTF